MRYLAGESRTKPWRAGNALGESRWGLAGLCNQPGPHKMVELSGGASDARALANISASHGKYRSASSGSPVRKN